VDPEKKLNTHLVLNSISIQPTHVTFLWDPPLSMM